MKDMEKEELKEREVEEEVEDMVEMAVMGLGGLLEVAVDMEQTVVIQMVTLVVEAVVDMVVVEVMQ